MKSRSAYIRLKTRFVGLALLLMWTPSANASAQPSVPAESEVTQLIREADYCNSRGRYQQAVQLVEKARELGTTSAYEKTALFYGLAELYRKLGRYKESEDLFKKTIADAEEQDAKHLNTKVKKGVQNPSDLLPDIYDALSQLYEKQSRFPEAERALLAAIEIGEKKAGAGNVALALPMNNLVKLYLKWGKRSDAKAELAKMKKLLFSTPESQHTWHYVYAGFNYAELLSETGDFKKAEPIYKLALQATEAINGFDHEYCAVVLESMGEMYRKEGRYAEAEQAFERVRDIREHTFSKDHPDYGKALLNLALVYRDEGRYAEAQELCQQATKVIEHSLGSENIELSRCWTTQASILRYQGLYPEAEKLSRQALEIDSKLLGADSPAAAKDMAGLADVLAAEKETVEAEQLLTKSLKISEDKLGAEHPDIATTIESLARIYSEKGDYAKAEPMYRRSLELTEKSLGKDNAQVLRALRDLADFFTAQKKYSDAEPFLKQTLDTDEKLFGKNSGQFASDLISLANLYKQEGKDALAAPLVVQAQQITNSLPGASSVQKYAASLLSPDSQKDHRVADKWALVIGISNFKDSSINLKYAAKDATDFSNFLISKEGFKSDHVQLLTDAKATTGKIKSALGDWLGQHAKHDDLVVIYVSSHGSSSQEAVGVNFLVTEDTDKNKLVSTGIPMQWLTTIIQEQVHCDRIVVILDVCHSGSATEIRKANTPAKDDSQSPDADAKGLTRAAGLDAGRLPLGRGQVVLASSLADQVSWESKDYENSVFTHRLIEALQCKGKDTTLHEAYDQLRTSVESEVLRDRNEFQTPQLSSRNWIGGDPVIAATPSTPRPAAVVPLAHSQLHQASAAAHRASKALPSKAKNLKRQ